MSDRDNVPTQRELGSPSVCPNSQTRLETLLHFSTRSDCHTLSPCCPRSSAVLAVPGALRAVSPGPLRLFCYRAESVTPLPCDTVMGCDMLFVGLVLIFCSPLTQQAWPLQHSLLNPPLSPRCSLPYRASGDDTWRLTPVGQHQPNTLPDQTENFPEQI